MFGEAALSLLLLKLLVEVISTELPSGGSYQVVWIVFPTWLLAGA